VPEDRDAPREWCRARADRFDRSGAITPRLAWVAWVGAEHVEDVAKVEADGTDRQLRLSVAKLNDPIPMLLLDS
jgi:hypothetical protein